MITKNQIKLIKSLRLKKNRVKHKLFVVEGNKNVAELLDSNYKVHDLFATIDWIAENPKRSALKVNSSELARISNQKNPNQVLALVETKDHVTPNDNGIILVLDNVKDPGNMGTIIRMCDWFGVESIVCSVHTAECYNPKVVQSSMGSIFRVNIIYTQLLDYLKCVKSPIYCACIDGKDVKQISFPRNLHLVMGNEANGIRKEIIQLTADKVKIENIRGKAESLNVAMAASILLHEMCG